MARSSQCLTRRDTDSDGVRAGLIATEKLAVLLEDVKNQHQELDEQVKAFEHGPLRGSRADLAARQHEHQESFSKWITAVVGLSGLLAKSMREAVDERKNEFRWDQRMNPLSRRHTEAKAAYNNEQALTSRCASVQDASCILLGNLSNFERQCMERLLPPLVMRLGQSELLDGEALGIVRAAVGNYGGSAFGLQAMLRRYRGEEALNFELASRELQRSAQALGADAVVGVRWLQCDEFEIEEERDDNRTTYKRVQRHKPFEAMLCGTAVRSSPSRAHQALGTGQMPFDGHLFCSTIREPSYGAVVMENLGIVQGVGVNATWNLSLSPTQATQDLAVSEALAFKEAHENLLAAARRLGADAVLGVKPEEPFHRMCVLRGSAVRLAGCSAAALAQPLARIEDCLPPSSLQAPPANLHIIETVGLVSATGMRPPRWWEWSSPAQTEEESFYTATQALSQLATHMGANAVFGVKWMHDNNRFVSNVVGTAVVLGRLPLPTPHLELPYTLQPFASMLREPPHGFRVSSVSPSYSGRGIWQSRLSAQGEVVALQDAVQKLQASAAQMGAHAIIGVKIEALSVYNCSRFMAVVKGTAVRLAQHDEAAALLPFHPDRIEVSSMQTSAVHVCVAQVHGLVCSVGYRPWRWAWGFRQQRRLDAENEQSTFAAAVQSLVEQARHLGANGVMAIKWQHDDDHRSSCLVGTAVTLGQRPGASPPVSVGSGRAPFVTTSRSPPTGMEVAHTVGVISGAGFSAQIFAFGAQDRANVDKDAFDGAMACLYQNLAECGCDAILGMKMESPEPGLVILRGTAVQLTQTV